MDPQQPYQPYQQSQQQYAPPPAGRWGTSTIGNIGAEVMAGLAYVLSLLSIVGFIGQVVIFAMEKNRFAKFHAAQAMLLGVVSVIITVVYYFTLLPLQFAANSSSGLANAGSAGMALISTCVLGIVGLVLFAFWIWGMISGFSGKATKLPIVGSIAEGLAGGPVNSI